MLPATLLVVSLSTGPVQLKLVDERGSAIANQQVWLAPTNSTKAVRPFGDIWYVPDTKLSGRTNASGSVSIKGVPRGKPMMVVTKFGNRFAEHLKKQEMPTGFAVDTMKLEGAVYAGRPARVVIAKGYEIVGRIVDLRGQPVEGVTVSLQDTSFGHMSGYPLTELDSATTDATGSYRFRNLPNCSFTVTPLPTRPAAVELRNAKGAWEVVGVETKDNDEGSWTTTVVRTLDKPTTRCDFRTSVPGSLTLHIPLEPNVSLKGWLVTIGGSGFLPGYPGFEKEGVVRYTWALVQGDHVLTVARESDGKVSLTRKVTLREGEKQTMEIRFSALQAKSK